MLTLREAAKYLNIKEKRMYFLDAVLCPVYKQRGQKMKVRLYDLEKLKQVNVNTKTIYEVVTGSASRDPSRECKCGCGHILQGHGLKQFIEGHRKKVIDTKKWKTRNKDKVKAQRRRSKARRQLANCAWLTNYLLKFIRKWAPVVKLHKLARAWKNVTGWLTTLKPRMEPFKRALKLAWKNITSWAECLSWTVTYTPDPELDSRLFVYGLVDPRSLEVRYIGKTVHGLKRPREHYSELNYNNNYKSGWVKQLRKAGLRYNIVVLEFCKRETLNDQEIWWISYGKLSGWRLTNLTKGGDGALGRPTSKETKAKISEARRSTVAKRLGN